MPTDDEILSTIAECHESIRVINAYIESGTMSGEQGTAAIKRVRAEISLLRHMVKDPQRAFAAIES